MSEPPGSRPARVLPGDGQGGTHPASEEWESSQALNTQAGDRGQRGFTSAPGGAELAQGLVDGGCQLRWDGVSTGPCRLLWVQEAVGGR